MSKNRYFNGSRRYQIPGKVLKQIEKEVSEEFPDDQMMFELHVLRAIKSKYWEKIKN